MTEETCAIGGVFIVGRALGACGCHGAGNRCHHKGECEHKREPHVCEDAGGMFIATCKHCGKDME